MPRVFVVAGENTVLQALPASLGGGVEVLNLDSSNEALWELQQGAPDVLIADVDLAGFNGLELADLVPDFAPDTRVVLCARQPDGDIDAQAAQRGLFKLVKGPSSLEEIQAVLQAAIAHQPPPRPVEPEPIYEPEPEPEPLPVAPTRATPKAVSQRPEPARRAAAPPVSPRPTDIPTNRAGNRTPFDVSKAPPRASIRKAPPKVSARPEATERPSISARAAAARNATPPPEIPTPARQAPPTPAPQQKPQPQAVNDEPRVRRKSAGAMIFTAEKIAPIQARLKDLGMQLGAQATVLTDRWGVPLVEEGRTSLPLPPFLPLLATSFSTMIDYTSQLHTDEGSGLYMHEGNRYDLYIFDVGRQFLLVMVFDKEIASSKLGSVWLYAKRAVRELAEELEG